MNKIIVNLPSPFIWWFLTWGAKKRNKTLLKQLVVWNQTGQSNLAPTLNLSNEDLEILHKLADLPDGYHPLGFWLSAFSQASLIHLGALGLILFKGRISFSISLADAGRFFLVLSSVSPLK
ncbi:MAG: hypothetical protein ACRCTY_04275 [Candidatus Adiutrix sp.]